MIVLRNRFLALFYRILSLGAFLTSLVFFWREFYEYAYAPICYFEVEAGLFYLFILFLAIILNIIDLRRGISGLASSVYMPVSLAATAYCFIGGIMGLGYMLPIQGMKSLPCILYYVALILIPLLEWILFEEKGGVAFYTGLNWMIYPVLYMVFSLFRAVIFPDSPVIESNGSMYCYSFYNPNDPLFFLWIFLAFLGMFLFFVFLLFLNNCLGRKYKKKKNILFD